MQKTAKQVCHDRKCHHHMTIYTPNAHQNVGRRTTYDLDEWCIIHWSVMGAWVRKITKFCVFHSQCNWFRLPSVRYHHRRSCNNSWWWSIKWLVSHDLFRFIFMSLWVCQIKISWKSVFFVDYEWCTNVHVYGNMPAMISVNLGRWGIEWMCSDVSPSQNSCMINPPFHDICQIIDFENRAWDHVWTQSR